jgi:hypothetical protein
MALHGAAFSSGRPTLSESAALPPEREAGRPAIAQLSLQDQVQRAALDGYVLTVNAS